MGPQGGLWGPHGAPWGAVGAVWGTQLLVWRVFARIFVIKSIFAFSADFHDFLETKLATPSLVESGGRANPCRALARARCRVRDTLYNESCIIMRGQPDGLD